MMLAHAAMSVVTAVEQVMRVTGGRVLEEIVADIYLMGAKPVGEYEADRVEACIKDLQLDRWAGSCRCYCYCFNHKCVVLAMLTVAAAAAATCWHPCYSLEMPLYLPGQLMWHCCSYLSC